MIVSSGVVSSSLGTEVKLKESPIPEDEGEPSSLEMVRYLR